MASRHAFLRACQESRINREVSDDDAELVFQFTQEELEKDAGGNVAGWPTGKGPWSTSTRRSVRSPATRTPSWPAGPWWAHHRAAAMLANVHEITRAYQPLQLPRQG
jgi:hypothetical protein